MAQAPPLIVLADARTRQTGATDGRDGRAGRQAGRTDGCREVRGGRGEGGGWETGRVYGRTEARARSALRRPAAAGLGAAAGEQHLPEYNAGPPRVHRRRRDDPGPGGNRPGPETEPVDGGDHHQVPLVLQLPQPAGPAQRHVPVPLHHLARAAPPRPAPPRRRRRALCPCRLRHTAAVPHGGACGTAEISPAAAGRGGLISAVPASRRRTATALRPVPSLPHSRPHAPAPLPSRSPPQA